MLIEKSLPFLEMELFWDNSGNLEFQVHQKKNQLLKYLNKEITHTKDTFKSTPNGVLNRLAKIISIMEGKSNMNIKERYPDHKREKSKAGSNIKIIPTFKELWKNEDET